MKWRCDHCSLNCKYNCDDLISISSVFLQFKSASFQCIICRQQKFDENLLANIFLRPSLKLVGQNILFYDLFTKSFIMFMRGELISPKKIRAVIG